MKYKRLKNQLRIHWFWLKQNEDFEEVYNILAKWIDTDVENPPYRLGVTINDPEDVRKFEEYMQSPKISEAQKRLAKDFVKYNSKL